MEHEKQLRQQTLTDGTIITQRLYRLNPVFSVWCPGKCCLFCKECSDVFYDYTNGPYMFFCRENTETLDLTEKGSVGQCDRFVESEDVEDHNAELKKRLDREKPYYNALVEAFGKYVDDVILFGKNIDDEMLEQLGKEVLHDE